MESSIAYLAAEIRKAEDYYAKAQDRWDAAQRGKLEPCMDGVDLGLEARAASEYLHGVERAWEILTGRTWGDEPTSP